MDADDCRKRAEECVRAAQNARPHHRALLLNLANKWLELTAYDEWTRDLLATDGPDKRPERRAQNDIPPHQRTRTSTN
jgi:hypothetical protein